MKEGNMSIYLMSDYPTTWTSPLYNLDKLRKQVSEVEGRYINATNQKEDPETVRVLRMSEDLWNMVEEDTSETL